MIITKIFLLSVDENALMFGRSGKKYKQTQLQKIFTGQWYKLYLKSYEDNQSAAIQWRRTMANKFN